MNATRCHTRIERALAIGTSLVALAGSPALGQAPPDETMINLAADRLNTITPQAVPKQTLRIGTAFGPGWMFEWEIPSVGELPAKLGEPEGAEGVHIATMNSYNMTYEFGIPANRPSDFRITLYHPDGNGKLIREVARTSGTKASVSFRPRAVGRQRIIISGGGRDTSLTLAANMPAQIGAFVVPNMLLTIVYEPAGDSSVAKYSTSSSYGTTVGLGVANTSGVVRTENPDWFLDAAFKIGGPIAGKFLSEDVATAIGVLNELRPNREVVITTETTDRQEESVGWSVRVERGFETELTPGEPSPGSGDRYIILQSVLFVYVVIDGKVHLAPMKAGAVIGPKDVELDGRLPPDFVARIRALNPHRNPALAPRPTRGMATLASMRDGRFSTRGPGERFTPVELDVPLLCESSPNSYAIGRSQIRTTTRSTTSTETVVKKTTGAIQSLLGAVDPLVSVSYSSTEQRMTGSEEVTSGTVECNDGQEAALDVYFDNIYRTLLIVPAEALMRQPLLRGTAQDAQGRPLSRQVVTLKTPTRAYRVRTDSQGMFAFRFSSITPGEGMLGIGSRWHRVRYSEAPKQVVIRGESIAEANVPAEQPATGAESADLKVVKPTGQPAGKPVVRPRRP